MSHKLPLANEPWYQDGLPFKCTECGQCCTGSPGYVWLTLDEILQIARYLNLSVEAFSKKYLRQVGDRYSLVERPKNHDCVFLNNRQCSIYPVRPSQCKTFPWWPQNLESPKHWKEAAEFCEGIQTDAPKVPKAEIEKNLALEQNRWENTS